MKKSKTKERAYTVAFMLAVTLVTVSAVSGLQIATRDIIERNKSLFLKKAILRSAAIELPDSAAEIANMYEKLVSPLPETRDAFALGEDGEKLVFIRSGPGLWGTITAVICYNKTDNTLVGVTFTKHNETPGLGGRIEEEWFQTQFKGRQAPLKLQPEGTESSDPQKIDAITGATITSKAVRDIVNRTYREAGNNQ